MVRCKNRCLKLKARVRPVGGYYKAGFKNCLECDAFIKTEGPFCPCCRRRLRNYSAMKTYAVKEKEHRH